MAFAPKGTQYRVSTPNLENVKDFPYTFKWAKLPGKTIAISRVIVTLINPVKGGEGDIIFSVFTARESFSRVFRSISDLLRSCDKVETQSIVKESVSKFHFDIQPPLMLENKNDRVELGIEEKPNLADENYAMCEGWLYDSEEVMVKEIMRPTIDVKGNIPVSEAVKLMVERKIGELLVQRYEDVMPGQTFGIITEQDLLEKVLSNGLNPQKTLVEKIMSSPLITINGNTSLDEAIDIMIKKKVRRLPVEEAGKIVGIITDRDVIKAIPLYFRGASKKRIFMDF